MIRLGILGCSEIAFRRFMPAVQEVEDICVVAIAEEYARDKLENFCSTYGIDAAEDFVSIICNPKIDAVYIPQPPSLHFKWAKYALEQGKHVLIEKPSTTSYENTKYLTKLAEQKDLALHENYMFLYHSQLQKIADLVEKGQIGELRHIRTSFTFPRRESNDFRYNKELGGGALLDAGGYPIKLATYFLGNSIRIDAARMNYIDGLDVDIYGSASLSNEQGLVCQISYGMDCAYQCSLEIIGSTGRIFTNRVFTAPDNYTPQLYIETQGEMQQLDLLPDSSFKHSIELFYKEIFNQNVRQKTYEEIRLQAKLVDELRHKGCR